jgi:hypothetical protein
MPTAFSQRLLAGLRTLRDEEEIRGDDTFQDPDDRVDPDERGPRLSVTLKEPVGETYALAHRKRLTIPLSGIADRLKVLIKSKESSRATI